MIKKKVNRKLVKTQSIKPKKKIQIVPKKIALGKVFSPWLRHHFSSIKFSLKRLWFNAVSTWITLTAIALALSLPTGLYLLLINIESLTSEEREIPTVSLFLHQDTTKQQAQDRAELLSELPEVANVHLITKEQAIENFSKITGFAELVETLGDNPLPHTLVLTPQLNLLGNELADIEAFSKKLKKYPEIMDVQIDIEWVQRLRAIMRIAERITWVITILLGLTVLLVIGNTIRLDIESRKKEIQVSRVIGATNQYIRRPFLYGGIWYGLFGGILSIVIIHIALFSLIAPVQRLAQLYHSTFHMNGLSSLMTLEILGVSSLLGLFGAWLAVSRHLRQSNSMFYK